MNWFNLPISVIRAPEYVGAEPVQRATWLNLMAYCCEQENAGRIPGAHTWRDRRWQQTCGVTQEEVSDACDLWSWDGDDLLLWAYPEEKQAEVQAKRVTAQINGAKGGRPRKTDIPPDPEPPSQPIPEPTPVASENPPRFQSGNPSPKAEEKGTEKEGKGKELATPAAAPAKSLPSPPDSGNLVPFTPAPSPAPMAIDDRLPLTGNRLVVRIQHRLHVLFPSAPMHMTAQDLRNLRDALSVLEELGEEDWQACSAWINCPERIRGRKLWPRDRSEFVANAGQAVEMIRTWWKRDGWKWKKDQQRKTASDPLPPAHGTTYLSDPPPANAEDLAAMQKFIESPFTITSTSAGS